MNIFLLQLNMANLKTLQKMINLFHENKEVSSTQIIENGINWYSAQEILEFLSKEKFCFKNGKKWRLNES